MWQSSIQIRYNRSLHFIKAREPQMSDKNQNTLTPIQLRNLYIAKLQDKICKIQRQLSRPGHVTSVDQEELRV